MAERRKKQYVQCTNCGHIYQTEKLKIDIIYVDLECPRCGAKRALNIGNDILDKYMYYDVTKDERYY